MSLDRLYTLRELSAATGMPIGDLRDIIARREIATVRKTPTARIRIAESAWLAWQVSHATSAQAVQVVVEFVVPAKAKPQADVDVDDLLPRGFKKPFPRSA